MRIDGSYLFPASAKRLFAALLRPETLARAIPASERLIQLGPPDDDGSVTFKAWVRGADGLAVLTWRLTPVRRPDSLRLKLWGHLPGGHLDGTGVLDLVARDEAHTRGGYTLELEVPQGALDIAAAQGLARAFCERLAGLVYAQPAESSESAQTLAPAPTPAPAAVSAASQRLPRSITTPRGRIVTLPMASRGGGSGSSVPSWAERVVWMGAGLALGLAAVSLILAVVHRLNGHDT